MRAVAGVAWDDELLRYDFGADHPMNPTRLDLTIALARATGVLTGPGARIVAADAADDDQIALVHTPEYRAAVARASRGVPEPVRGLGTADIPLMAGLDEVSARIVGGSVGLARMILDGDVRHGVNIAGGMHHARPDAAAGFCVYNDAAVAIRWLLAQGVGRIAYVDLDAHHGDAVQDIFWDDPRVLTISVHQGGLFPFTGSVAETGAVSAPGSAVNVPLPAGTDSGGWLRAIAAIVPDALREFAPDFLVTQHGCDAHRLDPLSDLAVGVTALVRAGEIMHDLAHEHCNGRWLALGGGGYEVSWVVPMVWTHLVATAAHTPIDPASAVPESWLRRARTLTGAEIPDTMGGSDGGSEWIDWSRGYDPDSDLDRAVRAARRRGLAQLGVDVSYDL